MKKRSIALLATMAAAACVSSQAQDAPEAHAAFVNKAKSQITKNFRDPLSVQYRALYISDSAGFQVLCGELNGKNAYGAYVGFRRFFADGSGGPSYVESAKDRGVMATMWPDMCGKKLAGVE